MRVAFFSQTGVTASTDLSYSKPFSRRGWAL